MALPRYRANNTPKPSGSANSTSVTPSPAPASGNSKTASSNKASQNSGAPVPGVLLGLSGGWLVARMFFFGGTLWLIEIIAISVAAGFVYPNGKGQKKFATAIIAVALLNLFVPGINPWIRNLRESQLNPPGEMASIVINRDGEYDLPARPLKVCFTQTGDPAKTFYVDQQIIIEDIWQITRRETGCDDIPESVSGKKVRISLGIPGKQYTPEIKKKWGFGPDINNDYDYYGSIGVSKKPFIQAR